MIADRPSSAISSTQSVTGTRPPQKKSLPKKQKKECFTSFKFYTVPSLYCLLASCM